MRHFFRIGQGLDVTPLMAAIYRQPELWHEDTYLRGHAQGPTGDVDSIILRFPKRENEDQHESFNTPAYNCLIEARPLIMNLMQYVGGTRLGRIVINRIRPGGQITPHCDAPEHAEYYERHHIVLQSSPGVDFRCEDEHVCMATGEVWWFNNALDHAVINNSASDRIHLIIDVRSK